MEALVKENRGPAPAGGADATSLRLKQKWKEVFGPQAEGFLVTSGTAANGLALSAVTPPWGGIFAHHASHIHLDECAGPEFFTGGAKIIPVEGEAGKITPQTLNEAYAFYGQDILNRVPPAVLSLTQGTESGTYYRADEVRALTDEAKRLGLKVHMDGSRLANVLAATGQTPLEATTALGVDILALGGTKTGGMMADAIIALTEESAGSLHRRIKRAGHQFAKQRYLAVQWLALLEGDLWCKTAAHANRMAARLADGLRARLIDLPWPCEINEVFPLLPDDLSETLLKRGAQFYPWVLPNDPYAGKMKRFVTSFETQPAEVDRLLALIDDTRLGRA